MSKMYDELIRRLRASCENCKLWDGSRCCLKGDCTAQTRLQAADAIEELSKKYLASEVDNTNLTGWLAEEHAKHLWIPVTERLPEKYVNVLCHLRSLDRQSEYYSIDHLMEDGQWWKAASSWKHEVTHWMPLPEPPKEA